MTLDKVVSAEVDRLGAGIFNLIWSGFEDRGVVRSSVSLVGGMPGAGKTTMLSQLAGLFANETGKEIGFVAAEQSAEEIKLYADRLNVPNQDRIRMIPALTGTVDIQSVFARYNFGAVIIDSLQGFFGEDQSAMIAFCKNCKQYADTKKAPVMIVSHINKEGDYAGLMEFQHAVDTLLLFEVDEDTGVRILRVLKNRFGRAHITLPLEMTDTGLVKIEEDNDDDEDDVDRTIEEREEE